MPKDMTDTVGGDSQYMGNGIFIDKCTVHSIEDKSNYPTRSNEPKKTIGQNGFVPELCLIVTVDNDRKFTLFGQFDNKKDKISGRSVYKGWQKKGNSVQSFLARLSGGKFQIGDDDSIMLKTLNQLIGKEFYKLRYCVGAYKDNDGNDKPSFRDYRKIQPLQPGADKELYDEFLKGVSFIKNYDPHYFDKWKAANDDSSSFNPSEFSNEDDSNSSPI